MSQKNYFNEMVKTLLSVMEEKEISIRSNSERIARRCRQFCQKLGLNRGDADKIYLGALLHDMGMIHVPAEIIQKNEKLNDGEWAMVRLHPEIAVKILSNLSFLNAVLPIVKHHHEAVDGSGYPDGLAGDAIPFGARLLCMVDSYDAMASGRPYRAARPMEACIEELQKMAGSQFDKDMVSAFVEFLRLQAASQVASKLGAAQENKQNIRTHINNVVQKFKRGEIELPVLPKVILRIRKAIENPISTADDVAKIIERDAVISLRLITVSNSAVYRGTEKIQTVRQAVSRLGMKQTNNLVTTISQKSLYNSDNEQVMDMLERLWKHSLAAAQAAENIARRLSMQDSEKFYLKGLLHDIGKTLLLKAMDKFITGDISETVSANIEEFHCDFGSAILARWGFAQDFARVAKMHDDKKFFPATQKDILVINLASQMASKFGYDVYRVYEGEPAELQSAQLLGLDSETLKEVGEQMVTMMQEAAHVF